MEQGEPEISPRRLTAPLTAEEVFRPWEMEGKSRRDCEPHRGALLKRMAYASMVAGGLSLTCMVPGLVGLPLGLATWRMACRDLDLICKGDMDTDGFHLTVAARSDARFATIFSLVGLFIWSIPAGVVMFQAMRPWL